MVENLYSSLPNEGDVVIDASANISLFYILASFRVREKKSYNQKNSLNRTYSIT
ncbi:hypothetical protein YN1HA_26180 [Sulfurisphaera ohwakuensis]